MGANNKANRAAKAKKRAKQRSRQDNAERTRQRTPCRSPGRNPGRDRGPTPLLHLPAGRRPGHHGRAGRVLPREGGTPAGGVRVWAEEHGLAWGDARAALLELLGSLATLPIIEPTILHPGTWRPVESETSTVDDRILSKVRGLLAKAESTEFEEEADALTAKAQDLMQTHAIEQAMLASTPENPETPTVRRMWLDAPYVDAKATLVSRVAQSNRCNAVYSGALGFVSLVGFAADLDTVELLSTSLMFQASRAMRAEGSRISRTGASRTRSFRQSFLVAYATRIGERLREATEETTSRIDAERGGALLLVLATRNDDVEDHTAKVFPTLVSKSLRISDREGYGAGLAAADEADIEVRTGIEDRRR